VQAAGRIYQLYNLFERQILMLLSSQGLRFDLL